MKKLQTIAEAYLLLVFYKLGFADWQTKAVVEQRKEACSDCVLRKGDWCSKRKTTMKCDEDGNCVKISGCGCLLAPKQLSDICSNPCPLGKWSSRNCGDIIAI